MKSINQKNICLLWRAGTDNRVVWESIVSLDRLENFLSLGHTYSYRQFPVMIFFSVLNWMSNNLWTKFENCNHSAKGRGNIQEIVALCTNLSRISFHMLVCTHIICVTYLEFYNSVLCALEGGKIGNSGFRRKFLFVKVGWW